jgi:hypothetical protein
MKENNKTKDNRDLMEIIRPFEMIRIINGIPQALYL